MAFIYKITNTINGKIYIGQTKRSLQARWRAHVGDSRNNRRRGYLKNAIEKYNPQNFKIEVLEEVEPQHLDEREIALIEQYQSTDPAIGYNIAKGGQGCPISELARPTLLPRKQRSWKPTPQSLARAKETWRLKREAGYVSPLTGRKKTKEHAAKVGAATRGRVVSAETKAIWSAQRKGRRLSAETRAKMSKAKKGRFVSEETKRRMAESMKKHFETNLHWKIRRNLAAQVIIEA